MERGERGEDREGEGKTAIKGAVNQNTQDDGKTHERRETSEESRRREMRGR